MMNKETKQMFWKVLNLINDALSTILLFCV